MTMRLTGCETKQQGLKEIGLEIHQSRSCYTRHERTEWNHRTHSFEEKIVILDAEATEWKSTAADEEDESLVRERLEEACQFAGHVETIAQLHLDTRKTEALRLLTSKSIARALDFDANVVSPMKLKPLAEGKTGETSARS